LKKLIFFVSDDAREHICIYRIGGCWYYASIVVLLSKIEEDHISVSICPRKRAG